MSVSGRPCSTKQDKLGGCGRVGCPDIPSAQTSSCHGMGRFLWGAFPMSPSIHAAGGGASIAHPCPSQSDQNSMAMCSVGLRARAADVQLHREALQQRAPAHSAGRTSAPPRSSRLPSCSRRSLPQSLIWSRMSSMRRLSCHPPSWTPVQNACCRACSEPLSVHPPAGYDSCEDVHTLRAPLHAVREPMSAIIWIADILGNLHISL